MDLIGTEPYRRLGFKYSICWMCTWRCNLKCQYCGVYHIREGHMPGPEGGSLAGEFREKDAKVPYQSWIDAFNKLDGPAVIDISGGEPFLFPNMFEIIEGTEEYHQWAITSNLCASTVEQLLSLPKNRIKGMTASFHLCNPDHEGFFTKIGALADYGIPLNVNFVAHPSQLSYVKAIHRRVVDDMGIALTLEPYSGGDVVPFRGYNKKELDFLGNYWGCEIFTNDEGKSFAQQSRDIRERMLEPEKQEVVHCNAGVTRFMIAPDGTMYPCNVMYMKARDKAIGNFLGEWKLHREFHRCALPCTCGGDAENVVRVVGADWST